MVHTTPSVVFHRVVPDRPGSPDLVYTVLRSPPARPAAARRAAWRAAASAAARLHPCSPSDLRRLLSLDDATLELLAESDEALAAEPALLLAEPALLRSACALYTARL